MNQKLEKIHELRKSLEVYGGRPPFDVLKQIDKEYSENKIDNWLVRCNDTQFNTAKNKGDLNSF